MLKFVVTALTHGYIPLQLLHLCDPSLPAPSVPSHWHCPGQYEQKLDWNKNTASQGSDRGRGSCDILRNYLHHSSASNHPRGDYCVCFHVVCAQYQPVTAQQTLCRRRSECTLSRLLTKFYTETFKEHNNWIWHTCFETKVTAYKNIATWPNMGKKKK